MGPHSLSRLTAPDLRRYTQFTLARGIGFGRRLHCSPASSARHTPVTGEKLGPGLEPRPCSGLFSCLTVRRTGDLWFAVGFHAGIGAKASSTPFAIADRSRRDIC